MTKKYRLGVSLLALLAAAVVTPQSAMSADLADPGCSLQAAVSGGGLLGSQSYEIDGAPVDDPDDSDWSALFAEAAGLVTCDVWNFQGDFAYYDHSVDLNNKDVDEFDMAANHFGGAVFWRDQDFAAFGLSGSYISQDVASKDNEYYRVGLFGEFYLNDQFTLGGSANYINGSLDIEEDVDFDNEGFELSAYAKFYAMPELALSLRGDYLNSDLGFAGKDNDAGYNGFALTAEAEYLVWDEGLSVFGGARYASRVLEFDSDDTDDSLDFNFDDMQVYAGLKIALGGNGISLAERDRSSNYDNTSVMLEKLPNWFGSLAAAESD